MTKVLGSQLQNPHKDHTALSRAVVLVAVAALLFSIWASFVGFHHSVSDFRQTQTAISAEYMEHGGPFLRYETPVFGPPWSIPFEFPLYQKIVALISGHLRFPLEPTGRVVSIVFFYLCFLPLASILKRLRYSTVQILAILSIFAVSPLYIFFSRLILIESTALFFSLMYADTILRLAIGDIPWRYRDMFLGAVFGSLAGLVKVTTFAPYLLLGCAVVGWQFWKHYRNNALSLPRVAAVTLLCAVLPTALTTWWTRFADSVRAQNPIGAFFLNKALIPWNFGTLSQRLHPANYLHFMHAIPGQAGSLPLLLLLLVVYVIIVRKWNFAALISLAVYVVTPMIFFNLHLIHDDYPYANAVCLIVSAGLLIADLLSIPGRRTWLGFGFFVAVLAACLIRYHQSYYQLQKQDTPGHREVAAIVDRATNPNDVIVITGLDWSSELPYHSHRRSIMDSDGIAAAFPNSLGPIASAIQNQHAETIPAIVVCDQIRGTGRARALLELLQIPSSTTLHADDCDIYLRSPK